MPRATTKEVSGCNEIQISIEFESDNPIEQAFRKSLIDSFSPEIQTQLINDGRELACVDCTTDEKGNVVITGLAEDINGRLHSPPLVLPDEVLSDPDKQRSFWRDVGDVIYETSQCQVYRERDRLSGTSVLSAAHQAVYEVVMVNKIALTNQRSVDELFQSILKKELFLVQGMGYFNASTGTLMAKTVINQLMPLITSHPKWHDEPVQAFFQTFNSPSSPATIIQQLGGPQAAIAAQPVADADISAAPHEASPPTENPSPSDTDSSEDEHPNVPFS